MTAMWRRAGKIVLPPGWLLPFVRRGVVAEHMAGVRTACGLFDVSACAGRALQNLNRLTNEGPAGYARYSLMCMRTAA